MTLTTVSATVLYCDNWYFQLRSSINAGLTEWSLYNRFCYGKVCQNLVLGGFWGERLRYLVGTPLGMQWPPIYVVWWTNCGDALNTLVCTRGKEIAKKTIINGMSTPWGLHFTLVQCLPPKPLVTTLCMWGPMGDAITRAQFQLNRFRG